MRSLLTPLLFGAMYVAAGIITARFASSAGSIEVRNAWRLAAWGISVLVYGTQLVVERFRLRHTNLRRLRMPRSLWRLARSHLLPWGRYGHIGEMRVRNAR